MSGYQFEPDWFSKPGDTLAELMARRNMSYRELADDLKEHAETVSGILAGKVAIDEKIATRLAKCAGGTKAFWMKRQAAYDAALTRAAAAIPPDVADAWLKQFPSKVLADSGLSRRSGSKEETLRSFIAFFGVNDPSDWKKRYADFPGDVAFRNTPAFETNRAALAIWLRQGELEAAKLTTAKWNASLLRDNISQLRKLSKWKSPADFAPALRAICATAGVATVFVRAPQGCRASGASRFLSPDKAMVVLSFRHLSDDHFWFTFFHELAHLLLHGTNSTFVDHDDTTKSEREDEANTFSENALVPLHRHDELISLSPKIKPVVRFALSVGVSPGIIVGQLQHFRCIGRDKLNFLKRRYNWAEVAAAFA